MRTLQIPLQRCLSLFTLPCHPHPPPHPTPTPHSPHPHHTRRDVYRSALATLDARRGSLLRSLGLDSRVHVTAGLGPAMEGGEVARMRAACEGTERVIAEVVAGAVALEMEAGHLEVR